MKKSWSSNDAPDRDLLREMAWSARQAEEITLTPTDKNQIAARTPEEVKALARKIALGTNNGR